MTTTESQPQLNSRCQAIVRVHYEGFQPRHCRRLIAFDDPDLPMCQYHHTMATRYKLDFEVDLEGVYPDEV